MSLGSCAKTLFKENSNRDSPVFLEMLVSSELLFKVWSGECFQAVGWGFLSRALAANCYFPGPCLPVLPFWCRDLWLSTAVFAYTLEQLPLLYLQQISCPEIRFWQHSLCLGTWRLQLKTSARWLPSVFELQRTFGVWGPKRSRTKRRLLSGTCLPSVSTNSALCALALHSPFFPLLHVLLPLSPILSPPDCTKVRLGFPRALGTE